MSDVTEFKRDHYYQALREYGLPHHLAETIVDEFGHACGAMVVGAQINEQLRAEVGRLKAELAALKARRCETCHFWHDDECALWDGIPMGKQGRCDQWEPKDAADDEWRPSPCFPGCVHDWERLPQCEWPWIACCRICGLSLVEGEEEGMQEDEEAADG